MGDDQIVKAGNDIPTSYDNFILHDLEKHVVIGGKTLDEHYDHVMTSLGNSYDVLNSNNVGSSNNFVQKSSSSGSLIFQLGSAGIGSEIGFFYNPEDVVVDSHDNFYVADRSNSRVQVFDSDGFYFKTVQFITT